MVPPMIVGVPMRPAMVVPTPVFVPTRQMAPVYLQPNMDDDEPASKRQRTEENLIPEGEFLARNLSPVTFKVRYLSFSIGAFEGFVSNLFFLWFLAPVRYRANFMQSDFTSV